MAARQHWRQAVGNAAVGLPTPIVVSLRVLYPSSEYVQFAQPALVAGGRTCRRRPADIHRRESRGAIPVACKHHKCSEDARQCSEDARQDGDRRSPMLLWVRQDPLQYRHTQKLIFKYNHSEVLPVNGPF